MDIDTSDEEFEEHLNDELPYIEPAEDNASSNDSENEPNSPMVTKFAVPPFMIPSRRSDSLGAEESVTGKPDGRYLLQSS